MVITLHKISDELSIDDEARNEDIKRLCQQIPSQYHEF